MSGPIRVLQVFGHMNRGGAESMIMNLYRNIDRSKVQFDFIVHTDDKCAFEDEINRLGGKIYRVPKYTGKNHFNYVRVWERFFSSHPEYKIIHGHIRSTASIYMKVAKKYNLMAIVHSHSTASRGNIIQQFVKNTIQFPIRYIADYMFACSNESGKWLYGKNVDKKDNYKVFNNAIDSEKYRFDEVKRDKTRKMLNIENKFVIGHIGSFSKPKNHRFLIDIFYEVLKKDNNSVLLLVGDGRLRSQVEEKVKQLNLSGNVIFTGVRSDIPELLQAMDVLIFPSIYEGLPVTLIEAQASGVKCFVSDTISKEVKITEEVEFLSLEKPSEYWAERILECYNGYLRKDTLSLICKAGYDVGENAKWLEDFYLRKNGVVDG